MTAFVYFEAWLVLPRSVGYCYAEFSLLLINILGQIALGDWWTIREVLVWCETHTKYYSRLHDLRILIIKNRFLQTAEWI